MQKSTAPVGQYDLVVAKIVEWASITLINQTARDTPRQ